MPARRLDPIVVVAPDPAWPHRFASERDRLQPVLEPFLARAVEHIGSTAVPGLAAKPIIDMLAVVHDIDAFEAAHAPLVDLGWHPAPEPGDDAGRRRSWCTPSVARRTHHLHVVEADSTGWPTWLAFRDALRADASAAAAYADLKRRLAARHGADPDDRDAYRQGKRAFIGATVRAWRARTGPARDEHRGPGQADRRWPS